eukprot:3016341-Amphidinium_carterae.1
MELSSLGGANQGVEHSAIGAIQTQHKALQRSPLELAVHTGTKEEDPSSPLCVNIGSCSLNAHNPSSSICISYPVPKLPDISIGSFNLRSRPV